MLISGFFFKGAVHHKYDSACENTCLMSSLAPEKLCQVNNPDDDVIAKSSALARRLEGCGQEGCNERCFYGASWEL